MLLHGRACETMCHTCVTLAVMRELLCRREYAPRGHAGASMLMRLCNSVVVCAIMWMSLQLRCHACASTLTESATLLSCVSYYANKSVQLRCPLCNYVAACVQLMQSCLNYNADKVCNSRSQRDWTPTPMRVCKSVAALMRLCGRECTTPLSCVCVYADGSVKLHGRA